MTYDNEMGDIIQKGAEAAWNKSEHGDQTMLHKMVIAIYHLEKHGQRQKAADLLAKIIGDSFDAAMQLRGK